MILDQAMNMMEKIVKELQETPNEKRDHFLKITLSFLEMGTAALQNSPEFRQGFAKIHSEFLKYPENKVLIEESIKAYEKYKSERNLY